MKVGIVMGGISAEREVSLQTGKGMLENLNRDKYEAVPIVLDNKEEILNWAGKIDFALIALHGRYGEDGSIQAVLEALNIPYSGCGILTSAVCMNKNLTKKIMKVEGLNTADWILIKKNQPFEGELLDKIEYPVVVKPNNGGSSLGTFIVYNKEEFYDAIASAFQYDEELLVEKYLKGEEYTVCILNGEVLPIISIKSSGKFFDYKSKYEDNGAIEEISPLPKDIEDEIIKMSKICWDSFYCKVYARVDIIVSEGIPYLLEINTLPGMTKNSLFPKSARAIGLSYSDLLDTIIDSSLK